MYRKMTTFALMMLVILSGMSIFNSTTEGISETRAINVSEYEQNMNVSLVALTTYEGDRSYQYMGAQVARSNGDLNGDGYDDIVMGDPGYDHGQVVDMGRLMISFGGPQFIGGVDNVTGFDSYVLGEGENDFIGRSFDIVGDINNDGYDDLAVGAPSVSVNGHGGKLYIVFGGQDKFSENFSLSNADASFIGEGTNDYFGNGVLGPGDVNGDGIDDLIAGSPYHIEGSTLMCGKVYVIFGKTSDWGDNVSISTADASFIGESNYQYVGAYNFGGGDVNNDGLSDFVIGAPYTNILGSYQGGVNLVLGRSGGWEHNVSLSDSDLVLVGEDAGDYLGNNPGQIGDVNGDGLDDIIFSADYHDTTAVGGGKVYVIFGRSAGWDQLETLDDVDLTFEGETFSGHLGSSIVLTDINHDGFEDIFIGEELNMTDGERWGKVHIFLGRTTGWSFEMDLASSDASILAEAQSDYFGAHMAPLGDISGTGQNCLVISAPYSRPAGWYSGKAYLIAGNLHIEPLSVDSVGVYENLAGHIDLEVVDRGDLAYIEILGEDCNNTRRDYATVNVSFGTSNLRNKSVLLRENAPDSGVFRGEFVIPMGVDYFDTITFYAKKDHTKQDTVYVDKPNRPSQVSSVNVYSDETYSTELDLADLDETIYLEVVGTDMSSMTVDHAFVYITSDVTCDVPILLMMEETGTGTGIYRSPYRIDDGMVLLENITVRSVRDPSVTAMVMIRTHVQIGPLYPYGHITQNEDYLVQFENLGWAPDTAWTFETDGGWLSFNDDTLELYGTPDNTDVGPTSVRINVTDGKGHYDEQRFTIKVENIDPVILTENVDVAYQGKEYSVDYDCDEDGQGAISWYIYTDASWLSIDASTGILSGTPSGDDVGKVLVSVGVFDGNGGSMSTSFNLSVVDINDPPVIITVDIKTVNQGDPYKRWYEATDPDTSDVLTWYLGLPSNWLSIDPETGLLEGTPGNDDVGENLVNVSVRDQGGLIASHEFILTVKNVNDAPVWTNVPGNQDIRHGASFDFDVDAEDVDAGTILKYYVTTDPFVDMTIDENTGELSWKASMDWFVGPSGKLSVDISTNDGVVVKHHKFILNVLPSTPPRVTLTSPADGIKVSPTTLRFEWKGEDEEGDDLTYDIYLSDNEPFVSSLKDEVKVISEWEHEYFIPYVLEEGKTYYWTVVPNDGCSDGKCLSGRFSFKVNEVPTIDRISSKSAVVGEAFSLVVMADDGDNGDLVYSLESGPDGMTIDEEMGFIDWIPGEGQEGDHKVVVNVTDGVDFVHMSFLITVEGTGASMTSMIGIIGAGAMVLVIIALAVGFVVWRKRQPGEEDTGEISMEDVDWSKDDDVEDVSSGLCAVATTVDQAHIERRKQEKLSYEDLYGAPAPKKEEEALTTGQLKDFISGQIRELEGSEE